MNSITINGKTITCSGTNVVINNGRVIVDGNIISEGNVGNVKVVIDGDINKIDCDGSVEVHGNSGSVECGGSCKVGGNVKGDIDAGGSVTCENVTGSVDAGGTVKCHTKGNMDKVMEQLQDTATWKDLHGLTFRDMSIINKVIRIVKENM